jgi:nitroimidazol reductase NimA-like FMN-containing flavoprotein (pyridoxamine 5'-phosphate oxidase superfamily)
MEVESHIDALSAEVCRHLLANEQVGRVAFVDTTGYPVVLPVNYFFEDELIVFRTDVDGKFDAVPQRQVAFEVEHLAPSCHAGWSVLVQGEGQDLTEAAGPVYEELRRRFIDTWAPGDKLHWPAIEIHHVSGRRIVSTPDAVRRREEPRA